MATEDESSLDTGSNGAEPRSAEDDDLRDSLQALSQMATGAMDLEDTLTRVAQFAVLAIPGADGAGLTLLENDRSNTIVTTASFVSEVDDIQYTLGQGPCISAAAEAQTVMSGSLGGDTRWPQFGSKVARLGVHSVVSLPLVAAGGVIGAMNVYAHDKHVFNDRAAAIGEHFALPAAVAVQNAQVLAQAKRLAAQLQNALMQRGAIERAVGIMMSRTGGDAEETLERLRKISQQEHLKLTLVAERIVDEAVRRARSRHGDQR